MIIYITFTCLHVILHLILLMCTVAIYRNHSVSVIEYLVENQDVKLTYNGKSDGSTILHLACR